MSGQDELNKIKDFLSSTPEISVEDKKYVFDFYSKFYYVKDLNEGVISQIVDRTSLGYGNLNSKIILVIDSHEFIKQVLNVIKPMMSKMNISVGNLYITLINKANPSTFPSKAYKYKDFIVNELNAIAPKILYVFAADKHFIEEFEKERLNLSRLNDILIKYISLEDIIFLGDEDNKSDPQWLDKRNFIWMSLRTMMNYKDKEITE